MRKRLALVACYGSLTGPWVRINPADKSLHVTGLGKGERIFIDSIPSTVEVVVIDSDGMFPLPTGAERIRAKKMLGQGDPVGTMVELVSEA